MRRAELQSYLDAVQSEVRAVSTRQDIIGDEIRDHVRERMKELLADGVAPEAAAGIVIDELGDARQLAAAFSRDYARYRRQRMMSWVKSTIGIAASVAVLVLLVPMSGWLSGLNVVSSSQAVATPPMTGVAQAVAATGLTGLTGGANLLQSALPFTVAAGANGVPGQINHQGVVAVNGMRYTGVGQFRFALVDPDSGLNVWTNDGSNISGMGSPGTAVSLAVSDGLYAVRLGDVALANMTAITPGLFSDDNLKLRVWFNDGINGVQLLSPEHPLTSSPYAFMASTVADEAIIAAKLASDAASLNKVSGGVMTANGGNVGIGTPTPASKLDVAGLAKLGGVRISDPQEQAFPVNEEYPLPGSSNIAGITAQTIQIVSKTRVGNLWILTGKWKWNNAGNINVVAGSSSVYGSNPTGWPYGQALTTIITQPNAWGNPGLAFDYTSTSFYASVYLVASGRLNGTVGPGTYIEVTIICVAN